MLGCYTNSTSASGANERKCSISQVKQSLCPYMSPSSSTTPNNVAHTSLQSKHVLPQTATPSIGKPKIMLTS